jgi:hypothetical protein
MLAKIHVKEVDPRSLITPLVRRRREGLLLFQNLLYSGNFEYIFGRFLVLWRPFISLVSELHAFVASRELGPETVSKIGPRVELAAPKTC